MVERLGLHQASIGPMIMMPAIDHLLEKPFRIASGAERPRLIFLPKHLISESDV